MGEGCVAKRTGETACDGDEGQGAQDLCRGDDGRDRGSGGCRHEEVYAAHCRCEEGLHRVEEDGEMPHFWGGGGSVSRCRELLLEICPCQAIESVDLKRYKLRRKVFLTRRRRFPLPQ